VGETIRLTSTFDGFELVAYHAPVPDARRGGLVLIQEIFGSPITSANWPMGSPRTATR